MENEVYKAPESDVSIELPAGESVLASRWARLGASIVDGLILVLILLPVMYLVGIFDTFAAGEEPGFLLMLGMNILTIIVFALINGKLLIHHGQTIAKRLFAIKIVSMDDNQAGSTALLKRYGFSMLVTQIPLIGSLIGLVNVLFIFSSSKRCLHDLIANTKVVKA